jgi:long-chain-fatty-acid--[acyl-carrier-protein] ligase
MIKADARILRPAAAVAVDPATLNPKTIRLVNELLAAHMKRELVPEDLQADTRFDAIGLDSLDRMDLALKIEQQFGFQSDQVVDTLGQLWALADGRLADSQPHAGPAAGAPPEAAAPPGWFAAGRGAAARGVAPGLLADTVAEAFVRRARAQPGSPAVADAVSGVLSGRRLLVAAALMARRFAAYPETHVGVMLPASVCFARQPMWCWPMAVTQAWLL